MLEAIAQIIQVNYIPRTCSQKNGIESKSWADANVLAFYASSRIRRKGILVTRWEKTQQCWKRRKNERRDASQMLNFEYFKVQSLGKKKISPLYSPIPLSLMKAPTLQYMPPHIWPLYKNKTNINKEIYVPYLTSL